MLAGTFLVHVTDVWTHVALIVDDAAVVVNLRRSRCAKEYLAGPWRHPGPRLIVVLIVADTVLLNPRSQVILLAFHQNG